MGLWIPGIDQQLTLEIVLPYSRVLGAACSGTKLILKSLAGVVLASLFINEVPPQRRPYYRPTLSYMPTGVVAPTYCAFRSTFFVTLLRELPSPPLWSMRI